MSQFRERVKTNTPDHHNSECASNENNIDRKENFKKATEMKQRTLFNSQQCSFMTGITNMLFFLIIFLSFLKTKTVRFKMTYIMNHIRLHIRFF